jgi:Sigma-70, region 4
VERRSDLRELVDDVGRLPEDQRAALVMSEIEELGHAEVAEVLGCPREKVRACVPGPLLTRGLARGRVRERIGAAPSKATATAQPETGVPAAPQASDAAAPSAEAAPQSDAPEQDPGALPGVEVGADVGVHVGGGVATEVGADVGVDAGGGVGAEGDVDPPAALP